MIILAVFIGAMFGLIFKHYCMQSKATSSLGIFKRGGSQYYGSGDHNARAAARRARLERERAKYRKNKSRDRGRGGNRPDEI